MSHHGNHHTGRSAGHTTDRSHDASVGDTLRETAQGAADAVRSVADRAARSASEVYESAADWAGERYDAYGRRTGQHIRGARTTTEQFVQENPVLVGVIGLAAGLLLGALLPRTRPEDRAFGHWADEVRDQGMRYAREVTQRGREIVEETLDDVARGVHEAAQSQGAQGQSVPGQGAQAGSGPQGAMPGATAAGREGPAGRFQNT